MARKLRQTRTTYVLYGNKEVLQPPFVATKFLCIRPLRAYSGKTKLHAVEQNSFIKQFGITMKLSRRLTYLQHASMAIQQVTARVLRGRGQQRQLRRQHLVNAQKEAFWKWAFAHKLQTMQQNVILKLFNKILLFLKFDFNKIEFCVKLDIFKIKFNVQF